MYNETVYNGQTYNYSPVPTTVVLDDIVFDGNSLTTCKGGPYNIQTLPYNQLANINFSTYFASTTNGGGVLNKTYQNNVLPFTVTFKGATHQELIENIDEFKRITRKTGGLLDIKVGDTRRTARATLTSLNIPSIGQDETSIGDISGTFEILDPFFINKETSSYLFENITGDTTIEVTNNGSLEVFPIIYMVIKTATDLTEVKVTLNGINLTINQTFADGDLLKIDGVEKEIILNSTQIDYKGVFLPLDTTFNPIDITFNPEATNLNIDISVLFNEIKL